MQEHLLFNYGTKPFFGAGQLWVYRDNIVFKNIVIYFYCACQISRNSPSEVLSEPPRDSCTSRIRPVHRRNTSKQKIGPKFEKHKDQG